MLRDNNSSDMPTASIVVVNYNTAGYIGSCLLSLMGLRYPQLEIIVVDNGSTDGSVPLIRAHFPDVEVIELPDNKGFAGGASVGLYTASGDIVATVNPDVRLDPDWMSAITNTLRSRADVGVVGSKILYPDGRTIQHAGGIVHHPLATTDHIGRGQPDDGTYDRLQEVDFVTGAALAMWREVGRALNFFDDEYFPLYYEDVDLCWRARKEGLRIVYEPNALAYHDETVTLDRRSSQYYSYYHTNRLRFVVKRYSPHHVMLDFLPAEAARVIGDMPSEDRKASLAMLDNQMPNGANHAPTQQKLDKMQAQIDEIMQGWRVREKPFTSSAPIVGPLIARLKERVNNLSTRWYVRPILQQQVDYNASVARTLREMAQQLAELQARLGLQSLITSGLASQIGKPSIDDLTAEVETLRARLQQLETMIEHSQNSYEVMLLDNREHKPRQ